MNTSLNPQFDDSLEHSKTFINHIEDLIKLGKPIPHKEILAELIEQIKKIDFRTLADLKDEKEKLQKKHFLICCIEQVLITAQKNKWGLCKSHDFIYLYNGAYWKLFDNDDLQTFLGEAAEKMGVDRFDGRLYSFREQLYKQFLAVANLPKPEPSNEEVVINLLNGTFEVSPQGTKLRPFNKADFITYQLPFEYNPDSKAPIFQAYLDKVQPNKEIQKILAEYLGYLFIKNSSLKLEKCLLLYGGGANGKSVFFEIVNALLGNENVSCYSLQQLTDIERGGSYRARIANTLVNYASEIGVKLGAPLFKAMVSGEPIEARPLYSQPFLINNYAKLIFNCNELPKEVEQTEGFFRRFLIIPFLVTIPESEQDKDLHKKIINNELSGVFNWVLEGLNRLIIQKNFTKSDIVNEQLEKYKTQSDNVKMFLMDNNYLKSINKYEPLTVLFNEYRSYCNDGGYHSCSLRTFSERLRNAGFRIERKSQGNVVFIEKENIF